MSTQLKIQTAVARLLDRYREVYPSGPHTRSQARDWDVALVAAIAKAVDIGISEHLKAEHEHLKADHTNEVQVHNPGTNFTGFVVGPKDGTIFTNCAPEPKMEGATVEGATVEGAMNLKPCPFCGRNPQITVLDTTRPESRWIRCCYSRCGVSPSCAGENAEQAARRWNKRFDPITGNMNAHQRTEFFLGRSQSDAP